MQRPLVDDWKSNLRRCEEPTGRANCAPDDRLRDEAIHLSATAFGAMDCFASLAMTVN
jgi:hypothetical protein